MRKTALSIALLGALALPARSSAVEIYLQLPEILPPLVVIQPGVQVIPQIQHEVFFVEGEYWARHGGGWYRASDPHAGWFGVRPDVVPVALVKIPPGKYKNWKPSKAEKEREKAARKADKAEAKAERKALKKHGKD